MAKAHMCQIKAYLKGHESWDLASSVISTLIGATSNYTCSYIICNPAPFTKSHDPLSSFNAQGRGRELFAERLRLELLGSATAVCSAFGPCGSTGRYCCTIPASPPRRSLEEPCYVKRSR